MKTKSFIFFFLLLVTFGFNACTNNKEDNSQNPIKEYRLGLTKLNEYDQRIIFGSLPAEIKCALWKEHLSDALQMPLLQNQKELVQQMLEHLTPVIYDSIPSTKEFESYAIGWYNKAKSAFTNADTTRLINICLHLGDANQTNSLLQQAKIKDCDCVLAGAWGNCPISFTCKARTCRVNRCGLFWAWSCDALCVYDY